MMSEDLKSIQILGCGFKCPVHKSSDFGLPSRMKRNMGLLASSG